MVSVPALHLGDSGGMLCSNPFRHTAKISQPQLSSLRLLI